MALFDQYTKPGVYTRESVEDPGIILFGDLRIPIFIGEGQEEKVYKNIALHRGSSAVSDDLVVKENISDQFYDAFGDPKAPTREFTLTYFPVVKGDGSGTVTNTPTDITVLADGVPATVTSLNGTTGVFQLHDIFLPPTTLEVTYYFKRKDTYVEDEDATPQVPAFATWPGSSTLNLSLSLPGEIGNTVSLAWTSTAPVADILAVTGAGTDTIAIELQKANRTISATGNLTFVAATSKVTRATGSWVTDGLAVGDLITFSGTTNNNVSSKRVATIGGAGNTEITLASATLVNETASGATTTAVAVRTLTDIKNLINTGVSTLSSGNLTVVSLTAGHENDVPLAVAPTLYRDGAGPQSNTLFKMKNAPIVDGSNGGVVTNNPLYVVAKVSGVADPVSVLSVDGANGLVTLVNPVEFGKTLTFSYYTNNFQDTYDLLPAYNVTQINRVGYGPDRDDFIDTKDFVLEVPDGKPARIQWGASSSTEVGVWSAGYTPFDASVITTTLRDEKVYLQVVSGTTNGKNAEFTLPDSPMDGSGLSRQTNDPANIEVFVGVDPLSAYAAGTVRVIQLNGATRKFKLYTPPQAGTIVYASYYRNVLNDHTYTMKVLSAGTTGQGTYKITNELGVVVPQIAAGAHSVANANFSTAGIVWPINLWSLPDLDVVTGASPNETITLAFQDDGLTTITTPATQAYAVATGNTAIQFKVLVPGTIGNGVTVQLLGGTPTADAAAISGGDSRTITVQIAKETSGTRTLQDIINLFTAYPTYTDPDHVTPGNAGRVICEPVNGSVNLLVQATAMGAAVTLAGGANAIYTPYANRYKVTSSRTALQAASDGLGITGNATTNSGDLTLGTTGYLNQTYIDVHTGVKFTIVNPADAVANPGVTPGFGYSSSPSPMYLYTPGDKLVFTVSDTLPRYTSVLPTNNIPGLSTKVVSTFGMRVDDTAVVTTYNKSGAEPSIGDFYYVTYTTSKTDADLALKLFTNPLDAYNLYGDPNPTNKLSLAARLYSQNGGQVFGCIQIRKDIGLETASDQSFMSAIATLAAPVPGSDRKCDMIIPMTTSPVVLQYLNRHLITQAAPRNSGEAVGVYGYDFYATPDTMRSQARSLKSERMIGNATPGAILEIDIAGKTAEFAVGGEFIAAAMAGMMLDPAIDVATTLTRKNMVGFSRLIRRYDDPTMDLMAADGLTCLVERDGAFQIRHWVTTDNTSPLKREPTSRLIIDYTRRIIRRNLDQFIGRKLLQSAINSVLVVTNSTLKSLIEQEIIEGFKNLQVSRDDYDPTVLHVKFTVKPIFSLLWIDVNLVVTTKL